MHHRDYQITLTIFLFTPCKAMERLRVESSFPAQHQHKQHQQHLSEEDIKE